MSHRGTYTRKDTFWSRKRVEQNIKIAEIAEYLHFTPGIVGMYFTGQRVPTEDTIAKICNLFGVDVVEGTREFINAHKEWDATFGNVVYSNTPKKRKYTRKAEVATKQPQRAPDSVLKVLYGKLPCDSFNAILEGAESETDLLEYLYNKVGYDEYIEIYKAVKEVK